MRVHTITGTRSLTILVLILALTLPQIPLQASAQSTPTSSLQPGAWARYTINGELTEGVVTSNFTVTSHQGSLVNVTWIDSYNTGPPIPGAISINTTSGIGNIEQGLYFAINPGKTVGDPVYQNSQALAGVVITQTSNRLYAGAARQTNIAQDTNSTLSCQASSCDYDNITYYWDQQSGVFTEIYHNFWNSTNPASTHLAVHAIMTATNLWNPTPPPPITSPPLDLPLIIVAVITTAAIIIGAGLYVSRRTRKAKK